MRISWPARLAVIGTTVALAALCASTGSARASGAEGPAGGAGGAGGAVTSFTVTGNLQDVAAVSSSEAWAVGWTGGISAAKTLIVRWNGHRWSPVTSPKPIPGILLGLTKVSRTDIWAVGYAGPFSGRDVPLLMHWNGTRWSRVPGVPPVNGEFDAIGEAGGTLLAVGGLHAPPMLIMERIGTRWKTFPVPPGLGLMTSLVVTGRHSAWAAGVTFGTSGPVGDVLMRWNGSTWRSVSFPLHGADQNLWHLAAGPGGAVWAVGDSHNSAQTKSTPLSMTWNGAIWRKVAVTAPANSELDAVAFVPGGTAWAGGTSSDGKRTLILRWTGTAWSKAASPNPFATSSVNAVAATSPRDAWAVGAGTGSGLSRTFVLHWNGGTWH